MKHGAAGDLGQYLARRGEPVGQPDRRQRVEAERAGQPASQPGDYDLVRRLAGRVFGERENSRITVKHARQLNRQLLGNLSRDATVSGVVGQEDLQPRSPVVVDRPWRVEAKDLRAGADQRRRMGEAGESLLQ